jgi:hypothetical protein
MHSFTEPVAKVSKNENACTGEEVAVLIQYDYPKWRQQEWSKLYNQSARGPCPRCGG